MRVREVTAWPQSSDAAHWLWADSGHNYWLLAQSDRLPILWHADTSLGIIIVITKLPTFTINLISATLPPVTFFILLRWLLTRVVTFARAASFIINSRSNSIILTLIGLNSIRHAGRDHWSQYQFWHLSFIKIRVLAAGPAADLLCSLFVSENQWNGWSSINGQ